MLLAIIIIIGAFVITNTIKENNSKQEANVKYNTYIDNLNKVQMLMISGGAESEGVCNLALQVWNGCIYKKSDATNRRYVISKQYQNKSSYSDYMYNDFNDGLATLYSDSSIETKVSSIKSNKSLIEDVMKDLQNPSDDLKNCYSTVCELYDSYTKLADLATNPTGNYSTYSANKSKVVSDFTTSYDKLKTQIPSKKE